MTLDAKPIAVDAQTAQGEARPASQTAMPFDHSKSEVQQIIVGAPQAVQSLAKEAAKDAAPVKQAGYKPIDVFGVRVPQPVTHVLNTIRDAGMRDRARFLNEMPAPVVNHATNLCGVVQLAGEAMMMLSAGTQLVRPAFGHRDEKGRVVLEHRKWHNFATDPLVSIGNTVWSKAASGNGFREFWQKKFEPGYYKDVVGRITDLEKATKAEHAKGNKHLPNNWAARSTLSGLIFMTLTALMPDRKEDPVEEERLVKLYAESPLRYVGERLWQTVNVTDYAEHKRQYLGLGLMISGMCSLISGFRNSGVNKATGLRDYFFNPAHSIGGFITAFAGGQLIFSLNNEQGWEKAGAMMWSRLPLAGMAIQKRIKENDSRWMYYAGGQGAFQMMNTLSFLMGGAEKDKDGNVIDSKAATEELKRKYNVNKRERQAAPRGAAASHVEALRQQVDSAQEETALQRA